MKVQPKTIEMRTQQKLQIEAIVAKYENLAAQTPVAKAAQEELSSDFFRAMGSDVDFNVTLYSEQTFWPGFISCAQVTKPREEC